VGFRTAAWFWNSRNLHAAADAGNFDYITYRVNGGYNGKAHRDMYYARALQVLGG
jgi:putative chitinase